MQILDQMGLTANEQRIYLTLLEVGSAQAGALATKAKMHRRNAYDALARLVEKGLISSVTKGKRKVYEALHPRRLVDMEQERLSLAQQALPGLAEIYKRSKPDQEVVTLEGVEGMKAFHLDFTQGDSDRMVLGTTGIAYGILEREAPHLVRRLHELKRPVRLLWSPQAINREKIMNNIKNISKTLPPGYSSPTQVFLYEDKTAISIWSEKPIIVIIRSKEIQQGFRRYFDLLWGISN